MSKLLIIVGSARPTRNADRVIPWLVRAAEKHDAFDVELADLRDWPLPVFAEHLGTIGDWDNPTYSEPIVKAWNDKIKSHDAFIVVTPEYNHSVPGVLKNAIDTVWMSFGFRNKPVAFTGYSSGVSGAIRAIEHLNHIFVETESVPLRNTVVVPHVMKAFDEDGEATDPMAKAALTVMLDDLAWWSSVLEKARAEGELAPGSFRVRAALADS